MLLVAGILILTFLKTQNIQINSARPMSDTAMDHKAIDTPFNGCWGIVDCKFHGTVFTSMY
jgi:hypothetical protein